MNAKNETLVLENSLLKTNPGLAAQWNYEKNLGLKNGFGHDISRPEQITAKSRQEVWWKMDYVVPDDYEAKHLRGKTFTFEWKETPKNRSALWSTKSRGCPFISGKEVWPGFNDLATLHPDMAKDWDYEKNSGLKNKNGKDISTPDRIRPGSNQKVWWKMHYIVPDDYKVKHLRGKEFDFEWESEPFSRLRTFHKESKGCPYLVGRDVWPGFNDLKTLNPEVSAQWHPFRNVGLVDGNGRDISSPDKVSINSNHEVWWYLEYKDKKTDEIIVCEWKEAVRSRYRGKENPFLIAESKGEQAVRKYLEVANVRFAAQNIFQDRKGYRSGLLRDDFALLNERGDVVATIEFNGVQHYMPATFGGRSKVAALRTLEITQENDKIKTEYLLKKGIPQLVIHYSEFEDISKLVGDFIKEISAEHNIHMDMPYEIESQEKGSKTWGPDQLGFKHNSEEVKDFVKNILNGTPTPPPVNSSLFKKSVKNLTLSTKEDANINL